MYETIFMCARVHICKGDPLHYIGKSTDYSKEASKKKLVSFLFPGHKGDVIIILVEEDC